MKRKLLLAATIIIAHIGNAQISIGIKAGGNLVNQKADITEGNTFTGDDLKAYHAGLIAEAELGKGFYLQPQLLFSRRDAIHMSSTGAGDRTLKMNYLEAPVLLVYKFNIPFGSLYAGAGGSVGYAVGGKELLGGVKRSLYGAGIKEWKRLDAGLSFTAGIQLKNGLFASVNSYKGLRDIHKGNGISVNNKSTSASVGYLIDLQRLVEKR